MVQKHESWRTSTKPFGFLYSDASSSDMSLLLTESSPQCNRLRRGLVLPKKEYLRDFREARQVEGYKHSHIIIQCFMKFRSLSAWSYFYEYQITRLEELCHKIVHRCVLEPQRLLHAQTLHTEMRKSSMSHRHEFYFAIAHFRCANIPWPKWLPRRTGRRQPTRPYGAP